LKTVFNYSIGTVVKRLLALACALPLLAACGDEDGGSATNNGSPTLTYEFASPFVQDTSSVSYSGQIARQVLIADLSAFLGHLTGAIDNQTYTPTTDGDVVGLLDYYFRFDSESDGDEEFLLSTEPGTQQTTYTDISGGKDIVGKLAGNDTATDHRDWSTQFVGWDDDSIAQYGGSTSSPEGLIVAFFETIEENAIAHANGEVREAGGTTLPVTVTVEGQDLRQLTQKFLLGAVTFSQGTDDYLDDDVEGKGLLAPNTQDDDKPYTRLGHAWDEGFGYFGAARDYVLYTDEEIAGKGGRDDWRGYHDSDGDGAIDLGSEYNFAASVNAAKRDRGSQEEDPTDFTGDAFAAFVQGRALINSHGALSEAQRAELRTYRDVAVAAWERAFAATVVHYINDTLGDMDEFGTDAYSFIDHAKHWSEMKGVALAFQFNPRSPMTADQFAQLHGLLGSAPVLSDAGEPAIADYRAALLDARTVIMDAYGFSDTNAAGW
jgi:hypothetical protein